MIISEFFPLQYCMNMDFRPDRWIKVQEEFTKIGIKPIRISGEIYTGTGDKTFNGQIGCGLTHLKILKLAKEQNQNVLIFEDDAIFINDYSIVIPEALDELQEWDMLYLGGNICSPIYQVSTHLGKLTHAQSTHAYGVNKNFLDKLINYIEPKITTTIIDVMYANEIVPTNNCYIMIPMVAIQKDDYSDIEGRKVNYSSWMEKRFQDQLVRRRN